MDERPYQIEDLEEADLVMVAVNDKQVSRPYSKTPGQKGN